MVKLIVLFLFVCFASATFFDPTEQPEEQTDPYYDMTLQLGRAAALNDLETVQRILSEKFVDINARADRDAFLCGDFQVEVISAATPLLRALQCNASAEMVHLLVKHGADVNAEDLNGDRRPLGFAAHYGNLLAVRYLIQAGADVNAFEGFDRDTPLHFAAGQGKFDVVRYLLDQGADVNAKNSRYYTPLIVAAQRGWADIVTLLLDRGANVEAKTGGGYTALTLSNSRLVTKILLDRGANVNAQPEDGYSALIMAVHSGKMALVKLLLENGADLEARDRIYGRTPLIWAAANGHTDLVQLLLDKGANIEATDEHDNTALLEAEERGYSDAAWLLLDRRAQQRLRRKFSTTDHVHLKGNGNMLTASAVLLFVLLKLFL